MKCILDSYDNELVTNYAPQLNRRVRESENMTRDLQVHISDLEVSSFWVDITIGVFEIPDCGNFEKF